MCSPLLLGDAGEHVIRKFGGHTSARVNSKLLATSRICTEQPLDKSVAGVVLQNETEIAMLSLELSVQRDPPTFTAT